MFYYCAIGPGDMMPLWAGWDSAFFVADGRLLVPVWMANGITDRDHGPSVSSTIVSSDGGKSFQTGEIIRAGDALQNPNETTAVQLRDGSVMLNIRHTSKTRYRAVSTSRNGLTEFSTPVFDQQLADPGCFASICSLKNAALPGGEWIGFLQLRQHAQPGQLLFL